MKVGYCRVSTHDQHLAMQQDALKSAGCEEIYSDMASGAKTDRPGLEQAISFLREGDTIVVWKLDHQADLYNILFKQSNRCDRARNREIYSPSNEHRWY